VQQHGQLVGLLDREIAAYLPRSAEDWLADLGADSTMSSNTIANGRPMFSLVNLAKVRVPELLKRKETMGSPVR
jgi:hypothetical protein